MDCQCAVANGRRNGNSPSWGAKSARRRPSIPGVVFHPSQNVEVLAKRGSVRASHLPLSNLYQRQGEVEMLLRDYDCAERQSLTSSHGPVSTACRHAELSSIRRRVRAGLRARVRVSDRHATLDICLCARTRYTTRRPWMQSLWMGTFHWDVAVGRHCLRQKSPKDGGCPMLRHTDTTIARHASPASRILHRHYTHQHCTHLYAAIPRFEHLGEHVNCTGRPSKKSAKFSNTARTQYLTRNSRSAS